MIYRVILWPDEEPTKWREFELVFGKPLFVSGEISEDEIHAMSEGHIAIAPWEREVPENDINGDPVVVQELK